jgi:hypothetical protein
MIVDSKSTVVLERLPFLLGDVLFDHRVRDGSRGDGEVAARPQVAAPELLAQVWELFKQHAEADPFEPLDDLADALMRPVGNQEVDMVACHLAGDNSQFPFHCNLAEQVADAEGHRPHEYRLAVLRDPDQVDLEIKFAVRPTPVAWHPTILPHPRTRLKARGFHHP